MTSALRPGYPANSPHWLMADAAFKPATRVADVGLLAPACFTRDLLLQNWWCAGVEPNAPMRHAADDYLATFGVAFRILTAARCHRSAHWEAKRPPGPPAGPGFHCFRRRRRVASLRASLVPGGLLVAPDLELRA